MGIDFGGKRIGVAFSDPTKTLASGFKVIISKGSDRDIQTLTELAKEKKVSKVVFGLPLNADGTESNFTVVTRTFAEKFAKISGLEVEFEDERFTSLEAEEILKEAGLDWKKRKEVLDMVAAEIILQNYINKKRG